MKLAIPVITVLISLVVGGIIILATGDNPFEAYTALLQGSGVLPRAAYPAFRSQFTDFIGTLNQMTPLLFAALAVAVALKSGALNIGVAGQMLFGGFMATVIVGYSDVTSLFVGLPLALFVAAFFGGLLGAFIGFLKYKFNVNEVVSSIMTNFIVMHIISFFITSRHLDPSTRQSWEINPATRLTLVNTMFEGPGLRMDIPLGLVVALLSSCLIWFMFAKTKIGFELRAVGLNKEAARYAGMNVGSRIVLAMFLSGVLAGMAGATYYLGFFASIPTRALPSLGFDGIAVSLLGANNPFAIILAALTITVINAGSSFMQATAGVPREIASVITGTILLFSACTMFIGDKIKGVFKWTRS